MKNIKLLLKQAYLLNYKLSYYRIHNDFKWITIWFVMKT